MTYDPTKTYQNYGRRGCSALQVTEMQYDLHHSLGFPIRQIVTVCLSPEQVRDLIDKHPECFDSVDPEPEPAP
jgi:hypothetical protein